MTLLLNRIGQQSLAVAVAVAVAGRDERGVGMRPFFEAATGRPFCSPP
ncbi:hypothetical protein [Streptomyces marianii]|nr:hypothetical protein [Streptomyces marianii]